MRDGSLIRAIRDTVGYADTGIYRPDPEGTAASIRELLQVEHCDQICFIHSHPSQYPSLSHADIRYVQLFLPLNPIFENVGMSIVVRNTLKMFCLYRCQNGTELRSMRSFSMHSENAQKLYDRREYHRSHIRTFDQSLHMDFQSITPAFLRHQCPDRVRPIDASAPENSVILFSN